jgi:hypothetical protein
MPRGFRSSEWGVVLSWPPVDQRLDLFAPQHTCEPVAMECVDVFEWKQLVLHHKPIGWNTARYRRTSLRSRAFAGPSHLRPLILSRTCRC